MGSSIPPAGFGYRRSSSSLFGNENSPKLLAKLACCHNVTDIRDGAEHRWHAPHQVSRRNSCGWTKAITHRPRREKLRGAMSVFNIAWLFVKIIEALCLVAFGFLRNQLDLDHVLSQLLARAAAGSFTLKLTSSFGSQRRFPG